LRRFLLSCSLIISGLGICASAQADPIAYLDLRHTPADQPVRLDGTWSFRWLDIKRETQTHVIEVPSSWNHLPDEVLPIPGTAEYQLQVNLPAAWVGKSLSLQTTHVSSQFKAYANGQQVGQSGVCHDLKRYQAARSLCFQPFKVQQSPLLLRFVVHNEADYRSGLTHPLFLGPTQHIERQRWIDLSLYLLLMGGVLMVAFYHGFLFVQRREPALLWFALLCLCNVYYFEMYQVHFVEALGGTMPFAWNMRGLRAIFNLYLILGVAYLAAVFPDEVIPWVQRVLSAVGWMLFVTILLPAPILGPLFHLTIYVSFFVYLYLGHVLWQAIRAGRVGSRLFLASCIVLSLFSVHDLAYALFYVFRGITNGSLYPIGFFIFCLGQASFLAYRFQRDFETSRQLQTELYQLNQNLEGHVAMRTQRLAEQNQELEQLLHFKHETTRMLVHDLKNPLAAMLGTLQQTQRTGAETLAHLRRLCQNMLDLIQDMLLMQHYRHGDWQVSLQRVSVLELLERTRKHFSGWAQHQAVDLEIEADSALAAALDRRLIERALDNLLSNALRYTPAGGDIVLRAEAQEHYLCLQVRDTGPGLAPAALIALRARLEQPSQAGQVRGLGLLFVSQVCRAHGGYITLETLPEEGFCARLYIPLGVLIEPLSLRVNEQPLVAQAVKRLGTLELYEISDIQPILNQLKQSSEPQVVHWAQHLQQAVDAFDTAHYYALLKAMDTGNTDV
jgi:signal transduction histidine kinase